MKVLISFALLATTLFADSIVKQGTDISDILNQIDAISQTIKQKELENRELSQENRPVDPQQSNLQMNMSEDEKLQNEIMREEQELNNKEKKLELSQKKQDYYQKYEQIMKRSKGYLEKKTAQTVKNLNQELYSLKKKKDYTVNIKRYMKIGSSVYAYIPKDDFESAKNHIEDIDIKIENIKNSIKRLKMAENGDRELWMQLLASIDNQLLESPENLKNLRANPQPTPYEKNLANSYIKVQEGEEIEGLYIKSVNEKRVVLASKDK